LWFSYRIDIEAYLITLLSQFFNLAHPWRAGEADLAEEMREKGLLVEATFQVAPNKWRIPT
jgi:hypothetical protein